MVGLAWVAADETHPACPSKWYAADESFSTAPSTPRETPAEDTVPVRPLPDVSAAVPVVSPNRHHSQGVDPVTNDEYEYAAAVERERGPPEALPLYAAPDWVIVPASATKPETTSAQRTPRERGVLRVVSIPIRGEIGTFGAGSRGPGDLLGHTPQNPRRADTSARRSASGTRTCSVVSRSRMVTASSSSDSKSTVTHNGVPISS